MNNKEQKVETSTEPAIDGNGKVYEKWGIRKHRRSGSPRKSDGSWGLRYTDTPPFLIYNVVCWCGFEILIFTEVSLFLPVKLIN